MPRQMQVVSFEVYITCMITDGILKVIVVLTVIIGHTINHMVIIIIIIAIF